MSVSTPEPMPVRRIAVDLIRPGRLQARRRFDEAALRELAGSIRESGIVQPLVVRGDARGYELLAERSVVVGATGNAEVVIVATP